MNDWLTLSDAAEQLGIHPSTLRRWTDEGRIQARRTAGGHRRYAIAEITTHLQDSAEPTANNRPVANTVQKDSWMVAFQDFDRTDMRHIGQRLLGLLTQYLTDVDGNAQLLQDARIIGQHYGSQAVSSEMSLTDLMQAYLHFRSYFTDRIIKQPPLLQYADPNDIHLLYRRMNTFMSEVLIGTAEGYSE